MYPPERFDALVAEIRARSEDIMVAKRGEYSPHADRLQNFREVAAFVNGELAMLPFDIPPEMVGIFEALRKAFGLMGDTAPKVRPSQVAMIYFYKHVQSINEAVRSGTYDWCWEKPGGGEGLKQRVADIINYCYLLAACIDEEATQSPEVGG